MHRGTLERASRSPFRASRAPTSAAASSRAARACRRRLARPARARRSLVPRPGGARRHRPRDVPRLRARRRLCGARRGAVRRTRVPSSAPLTDAELATFPTSSQTALEHARASRPRGRRDGARDRRLRRRRHRAPPARAGARRDPGRRSASPPRPDGGAAPPAPRTSIDRAVDPIWQALAARSGCGGGGRRRRRGRRRRPSPRLLDALRRGGRYTVRGAIARRRIVDARPAHAVPARPHAPRRHGAAARLLPAPRRG